MFVFFSFVERGFLATWTAAAHQQNGVVAAAAAAVGQLAGGGCTVVYEGVVGPWFLETFVRAAGVDEIQYLVLLPPEEVCP